MSLKVKDKVYLLSNCKKQEVSEGVLVKIGLKYYHVQHGDMIKKFSKETHYEETNYGGKSIFFTSKQELDDKLEKDRLRTKIARTCDFFTIRGLSLSKLRAINEIIERDE